MKYVTQVKNNLCQNLDLIFRLFIELWKELEYMFKIFELVWDWASRHTTEYHSDRSKDIDIHVIFLTFISSLVDKKNNCLGAEEIWTNKRAWHVTKRRNYMLLEI